MPRGKARPPRLSNDNPALRRVVTAARHHFFAHGFRSVTMDDLAEELGMSKKTLYACFPSKTALLEAVLLDKFRSIETDFEAITSKSASDVLGALHQLLACVQRHTDEIQPPFVRDMRREHIQRHFGKLFEEGRRTGIIRKDIPAELVIEILLGAVQAVMKPKKMVELGLTPNTAFSAIIAVILEGIITATGRSKR